MYSTNSKEGCVRLHVDEEEVEMLLEKYYGLRGGELKKLAGFDDLNFKYNPKDNVNPFLKNLWSHGYIMKITNYLDSKNDGFTDAQNKIMLFLRNRDISTPIPVKSLSGQYFVKVKIPLKVSGSLKAQREHIVRLLEFQPGTVMRDVPTTYQILHNLGIFMAKFNAALETFSHPAFESHSSIWHLRKMPDILEHLDAVPNLEQRQLVETIVDSFTKNVLSLEKKFERKLIHGDFNEHNILMSKCENGNWEVATILDFGDTHLSCYLFELAISQCYMMLECKKNNLDPIVGAGHLLAGYLKILPDIHVEYNLLKISICARFCQSLVLGLKAHSLNPENTYVLGTQNLGWSMVKMLWETSNEEITQVWNSTIRLHAMENEVYSA